MFYPEENETDSTSNEIETSTTVTTPITIELINGSGEKTKLEKAQKILEEAGYKIKKTGKTSSISKTIITNKKDISTEDLNKLKEILSVGSITTNKVSNSTIDITIIIGRDFE